MWYTSDTLRTQQQNQKSTNSGKGRYIISHYMGVAASNLTETTEFTGARPEQVCPSVLHTINEPEILIELAMDNILSIVGAHAGSLFIWDEYQKTFVLKSSRGPYRERLNNPQVRLREGILGTIGDRGTPVLVKNINSDHRFHNIGRNSHYRSSSFLSLPLIAQNKLVGIINVTERENLVPFTEEDLHHAELFTKHVAVALENSRALLRLQNENNQLHQKNNELTLAIKSQESLVSVGKLATNLTHELNNPLDAIRRYVNLALDQSMEDSLTREYLLKAKKGIRRAIGVIRGLLQYSRELHHASFKTAELHQLIGESIETFLHQNSHHQIQIIKKFATEPLYVTDRGLPLVLKNLFQNACDAMNGNGQIMIKTYRHDGSAFILVEDTGNGIPEAQISRIFEPFYTTKGEGKGTGVGLTFCREIVEKSGGKINCQSQNGKGANFLIELPCASRS